MLALASMVMVPSGATSFSWTGEERSNSSSISPTISSRMSSMVTMPLVPPYSSMTIAMWLCLLLNSFSRSATFFVSGMNTGGLAKSLMVVASEVFASSSRSFA